jgi:SAM-dependent methyltransferase
MSFELKNCPLCDSESHEEVYHARDRHYGIPGVYRIVRCTDCSLVFLNPMYSDQELSRFYPTDYYAYQDNFQLVRWKEITKRVLRYRLGTRDPQFSFPGKMLDLGCGTGWFMKVMRDQGWETFGVEINSSAAELGRKSAGLNIFSGTLKQANFPPESFDYVRSNHSFEHISCPGETLDEIYRVLKPNGKVLIGVPNVGSLNARIFKQYWWYLGAPVHTFTYSVKTICGLMRKHGFAIQKVTFNSDFSGILGSSQIWLNRRNGRKSTEGAIINARFLRVPFHWAAKFVDLLRLGDAIEITAARKNFRVDDPIGRFDPRVYLTSIL